MFSLRCDFNQIVMIKLWSIIKNFNSSNLLVTRNSVTKNRSILCLCRNDWQLPELRTDRYQYSWLWSTEPANRHRCTFTDTCWVQNAQCILCKLLHKHNTFTNSRVSDTFSYLLGTHFDHVMNIQQCPKKEIEISLCVSTLTCKSQEAKRQCAWSIASYWSQYACCRPANGPTWLCNHFPVFKFCT